MKMIRIDTNSHAMLLEAKEELKKRGMEHPTHSDAIRWLKNNKAIEKISLSPIKVEAYCGDETDR